mgnify:CR=1 FL=1
MIDYNVTFEYLHGFNRMCDSFKKENCTGCDFFEENKCAYETFRSTDPQECINIVREWCNDHPEQTLLTVFNSLYPQAEKRDNGIPNVCAGKLGIVNFCNELFNPYFRKCKKCWNTPIMEKEVTSNDKQR